MAILCFFVGLTVVYGIVSYQVRNKFYQFSVLNALGCPERILQQFVLWEFIILAFISTSIGLMLSFLASYVASSFIFQSTYTPDFKAALSLSLVCCFSIIFVAVFAVLSRKKSQELNMLSGEN